MKGCGFPSIFDLNQDEKNDWKWRHISKDQDFKEVLPMTHWLFRERNGLMAGECKIEVREFVSSGQKPPRSPNFARVRLTYLFSTDEQARKHYTLFGSPSPRMGLLLEDFDMLAAEIANKHTGSEKGSYTVTRSATIQMEEILRYSHDLVVDAFVKRVGTSSITVYVSLHQRNNDSVMYTGEMSFVLVLLSSEGRPKKARKLEIVTSEEKWMAAQGTHITSYRTPAKRFTPDVQEMAQLHEWFTPVFTRSYSIVLPDKGADLLSPNTIHPTKMFLEYHKIMHYQQRNAKNVIYGGYLMKQGLEQAYLTVLQHLKPGMIKLVYYSLTFDLPVAIGTILKLRSQIVNIDRNYVFVVVNAQATSVADIEEMVMAESEDANISNKFLVILQVDKPPPQLLPSTYAEGLRLLDTKRRAKKIFKDLEASAASRSQDRNAAEGYK